MVLTENIVQIKYEKEVQKFMENIIHKVHKDYVFKHELLDWLQEAYMLTKLGMNRIIPKLKTIILKIIIGASQTRGNVNLPKVPIFTAS